VEYNCGMEHRDSSGGTGARSQRAVASTRSEARATGDAVVFHGEAISEVVAVSAAVGHLLEQLSPGPEAGLTGTNPSVAEALASIERIEQSKRRLEAAAAILTAGVVSARTGKRLAEKKSARNVASETARDVGLHRGLNRSKARRMVDIAVACPGQAPALFTAWKAGKVDEEKVGCFFEETKTLTESGRAAADVGLSEVAGQVGAREWRERLQATSARLEPERAEEKARAAHETRHVQAKSKPDGLMQLTAVLPAVSGQGVETILSTYARRRKNDGDERTPGQIKADLLTGIVLAWARATGQTPPGFSETHRIRPSGAVGGPGAPAGGTESAAEGQDASHQPGVEPVAEVEQALESFRRYLSQPDGGTDATGVGVPTGIGVQVHLVITDLALFGITNTPAEIFGLGPVAAGAARTMISHAAGRHAASLKRLYTNPSSGSLVAMESKSRAFPEGLTQLIGLRDKFCRHPFCDAPIRHMDHIRPHSQGGPTSFPNGQGVCAAHNLIKDTNHTTTYSTDAGAVDGPIVTRLASGAEFASPARVFPHEDVNTLLEDGFWSGYRAGRSATEVEFVRRAADLDRREARLNGKDSRLDRIRASLTRKVKKLAKDREQQQRDWLKASERQRHYDQECERLQTTFDELKTARSAIDAMHLEAEMTQAGLDDAQAFAEATRARLEAERTRLDQGKERLAQDAARSDRVRAALEEDRAALNSDRAALEEDRALLRHEWSLVSELYGDDPTPDGDPARWWDDLPKDPYGDLLREPGWVLVGAGQ
jgi:hypothetical protein